jgi:hypothetical protein
MDESFDPYRKWLGIPNKDQPPHHYRLLNIEPFESDPDVIANAADARMGQVKQYQSGQHSQASQQLLNEISAAKVCLLNPDKKAEYDAELRKRLTPKPAAALPPSRRTVPANLPADEPLVELVMPASEADRPSHRIPRYLVPVLLAVVVGTVLLAGVGAFLLSGGAGGGSQVASSPGSPQAGPSIAPAAKVVSSAAARPSTPSPKNSGTGVVPAPSAQPVAAQPADAPVPGASPDASAAPDAVHIASRYPKPEERRRSIRDMLFGGSDAASVKPEANAAAQAGQVDASASAAAPASPAAATPPPASPSAPAPLAVPDAATQEKIKAEVSDIFKKEFAEAASPEKKSELAQKLLKQGEASANEPDARFVVLRMACDLMAEAGDVRGAMAAVDAMQRHYDIRPLTVKTYLLNRAIESMPSGSTGTPVGRQISETAMELAETYVNQDDYDAASGLANLALTAARKTHDSGLIQPLTGRDRELNRMKTRFAAVKKSLETLAGNADDAEANLAAGRWYCLSVDNWEKGLPLLAKGGDEGLAKLARQEIASPAEPASQAALGDGWWDLAERDEDIRGPARARAHLWYERAAPTLAGLDKVRVKKRLETLAETPAKADPKEPKGPLLRGAVQPGNVALASNGTVVLGAGDGEQMIDGNSTEFGPSTGFATGNWPCEWTVVFKKAYRLKQIRFRLWDKEQGRYYRYALATSEDGNKYTPLVDRSQGEWRGWQVIPLPGRPVKCLKIFGLYNSANAGFFIVELEAYCTGPK